MTLDSSVLEFTIQAICSQLTYPLSVGVCALCTTVAGATGTVVPVIVTAPFSSDSEEMLSESLVPAPNVTGVFMVQSAKFASKLNLNVSFSHLRLITCGETDKGNAPGSRWPSLPWMASDVLTSQWPMLSGSVQLS